MLRRYLIDAFSRLRTDARRGVVAEFSLREFDATTVFARIGSGSMGGKGRGSASSTPCSPGTRCRRTCAASGSTFRRRWSSERMSSTSSSGRTTSRGSPSPTLRTGDRRGVHEWAFLRLGARRSARLHPQDARSAGRALVQHPGGFSRPAVRRDLPNLHARQQRSRSRSVRFEQLCDAIELVYASVFFRNAKAYIQNTQHRMEEEKMAVVLQQARRTGSTGATSIPTSPGWPARTTTTRSSTRVRRTGSRSAALGLGKTVVDGERAVRFSPGRPHSMPQFSSTADIPRRMRSGSSTRSTSGEGSTTSTPTPTRRSSDWISTAAEAHGTLGPVALHLLARQRRRIRRHLQTGGPAGHLRAGPEVRELPPAEDSGPPAVARQPACQLPGRDGVRRQSPSEPRRVSRSSRSSRSVRWSWRPPPRTSRTWLGRVAREEILAASDHALGQGRIRDIVDIIYVRPEMFDRSRTHAVAQEVGSLNAALVREGRPYLLIGPGRWGTSDPWLGIPVEWHQICGNRRDHRDRSRRDAGHALGGDPLLPEPDRLRHRVLQYPPPRRGQLRRLRVACCAAGRTRRRPSSATCGSSGPLDIRVDGRSRRGLVLKGG